MTRRMWRCAKTRQGARPPWVSQPLCAWALAAPRQRCVLACYISLPHQASSVTSATPAWGKKREWHEPRGNRGPCRHRVKNHKRERGHGDVSQKGRLVRIGAVQHGRPFWERLLCQCKQVLASFHREGSRQSLLRRAACGHMRA